MQLAAGDDDVVPGCTRGNRVVRGEAQRWRVRLEDRPRAYVRVSDGDDGVWLDAGGSTPSEARPAIAWAGEIGLDPYGVEILARPGL